MALDVYKEWLGIPEGPRPPDHYALLRLKQFDDEVDRIRANYKKLNGHVRRYATGQYLDESQALLNELLVLPFDGLDEAPLGVLLLEGTPAPERAAWVDGFTALVTRAIAECQRYNQFEGLLFDAAIAVASSKPTGRTPGERPGGKLRTLCCGIAAHMGLGESDVRRVGFLATLHVLGPEALAEGMRQLRHGRETGRRWREARSAPADWEIYPSPLEAWEGLFQALAAPGGAERVGLSRLAAILRVGLAYEQALAARPRQEPDRVKAALAQVRAGAAADGPVLKGLAAYLGLA
jgi:hypothetical protein